MMKNDELQVRYGFIFEFKDGGWNIVMFDEDGNRHEYYSSDEHTYSNSYSHLEDYVGNKENIRHYKTPNYSEFNLIVTDDLIFKLPNKDIHEFERIQ